MSMDGGMYRMRDAHKRMKRSEETAHPVTDEEMDVSEHERTLGDIMQNKKEQDKFLNRFCSDEDPAMTQQITTALESNTLLNPDQDKFLSKMLGRYNLRTAELEQIREMLTPEEMMRIGENDPRIQRVIDKIGPEKAAELFGKEFEELALSDGRQFNKLVKQMRQVHGVESGVGQELDEYVRQQLTQFGIREESYWEATKTGMTVETENNLRRLARENLTIFGSAIESLKDRSPFMRAMFGDSRSIHLMKNFENQTEVLQSLDKYRKAIGRVLQGTLTPEVNMAIQKAMLEGGEVREKKIENNVTSLQDYQGVKNDANPDPDATKARWEKYKPQELARRKIKNLGSLSAVDRGRVEDEMKTDFANKELERRKGYRAGAAFAALLGLLFATGPQTEDEVKNLLTF
jgi:hypothetical protein